MLEKWNRIHELPKVIPCTIPNGESGSWNVSSFDVSKEDEDFGLLRVMISPSVRGRYVPAGQYKRLRRGGTVVMSNTPDEIRDLYQFFRGVEGRVLINGLGLGICLSVILSKVTTEGMPAVTSVTVVERSEDVIALVSPSFSNDPRVQIIHADALEHKPVEEYDFVWHNIWDTINSDNLKDMHKLHRRYGRKSAWQGSWCRELCELGR